jgi:hypothetical protein
VFQAENSKFWGAKNSESDLFHFEDHGAPPKTQKTALKHAVFGDEQARSTAVILTPEMRDVSSSTDPQTVRSVP